MFIVATLMSFSVKSNVCLFPQAVSLCLLSPSVCIILSCFFAYLNFLWETGNLRDVFTTPDTCFPGSEGCYCCLFTDWLGYFSAVHFAPSSFPHHEACDVAPQWVQPWACPQAPWNDRGFGRAFLTHSFPDLTQLF